VAFLDAVSAHMQGAASWEALEVAVFAAGAVSPGVLHSAGLAATGALGQGQGRGQGQGGGQDAEREKEKEAALQFMARLFWSLPGAAALATPGKPRRRLPPCSPQHFACITARVDGAVWMGLRRRRAKAQAWGRVWD